METTSQRKYFKGLRALALTALFCTIALTLFIWGEALTPGDKSAIQSAKVSDNIQSAMKTDEPAPPVSAVTGYVVKSVRRDGKVLTDVDHYYTGDVLELGVKCLPENADTSKLYFERGFDAPEDYINVEENGEVTLSKWGYHRVVIKSKDNPDNVLYDLKIYNEGVNPDKVKGIKTEIYHGKDLVKAKDGIITLETCEEYRMSVLAVTDDEYNGYGVSTIETEILINGEKHNANDKIFFLSAKQWFYPLKPTDGDLTLEIKLGDKTVSQKIRIVEGSKPEATGFTFDKRATKNDDGSFSLTMKKDEHLVITSQLGFRAINESEGAPSNIISKSSDTNVVNASTTHLHAYKPGTATITYFSIYDNTITATLHVTVPDVVDGLTVVAPTDASKAAKSISPLIRAATSRKTLNGKSSKAKAQSTKTVCLRPTNRAKLPCAQRTSAAPTLPSKRRLPCPSSTPSTRLYEKGSDTSRFSLCWGSDCSARSSCLLSRDGRRCPFPCFRRLSSQAFRKCSNCPFSQADDTQPGRTSQSIFWARCRASASPLSRYRSSGLSGLRQNPKVSKI